MSIPYSNVLTTLALANSMIVLPALGDSYEGKTVATMAGILMMLANDAGSALERRNDANDQLATLFNEVASEIDDVTLSLDIRLAALSRPRERVVVRFERMLRALELLHAWADDHSPDIARRCRHFLRDFCAGDRMQPPGMPDLLGGTP